MSINTHDLKLIHGELMEYRDSIHAVKWEWRDSAVLRTSSGKCFPLPEQEVYAEELCKFLNKSIARNGGWRVVWLNPKKEFFDKLSGLFRRHVPQMLECQYTDKEWDTPVVVELEQSVWDLLENYSFTDVANLCDEAYRELKAFEYDIGVTSSQKYSPASGQQERVPGIIVPQF